MSNPRPLAEVKPTKTLLIDSSSCEEKAAHIQNEAVHALQNNNDMEVGYRYLQSRCGRISTSREATLAGIFAILMLVDLYKNPGPIAAVGMLFYAASALPNINNRSRYQETENACAEWLKKKFGEQEFKQLQNMSYNKKGLDSLTLFLRSKGITATEKKHGDIEIIQNSFLSFTVAYFRPELILLMLAYEIFKLIMKKLDSHQVSDANPRPSRI